jgi:hypothetical protein
MWYIAIHTAYIVHTSTPKSNLSKLVLVIEALPHKVFDIRDSNALQCCTDIASTNSNADTICTILCHVSV